jgi:hypothetical protein
MKVEPHNTFTRSLDFVCVIVAFATASGFADLLNSMGFFTWPDTPARALLGWPPDYAILLIASLVSWSAVSSYFGIHRGQLYREFQLYVLAFGSNPPRLGGRNRCIDVSSEAPNG